MNGYPGGARYSVPPETLGQLVEVRREVGADRVEIRWAGRLVAAHTLVAGRLVDVWDPEHLRAAETAAMQNRPQRPALRLVASSPQPAPLPITEDLDVAPVDLSERPPSPVSSTPSARARETRSSAQSFIAASSAAPLARIADIF